MEHGYAITQTHGTATAHLLQSVILPSRTTLICIVSSGKVLQGSQAIRQANLRAGLGVAAVAGTPAEKLEPKEVAELIRLSKRPMEIVFRWGVQTLMNPSVEYFSCSPRVKMNPCLPSLYPTRSVLEQSPRPHADAFLAPLSRNVRETSSNRAVVNPLFGRTESVICVSLLSSTHTIVLLLARPSVSVCMHYCLHVIAFIYETVDCPTVPVRVSRVHGAGTVIFVAAPSAGIVKRDISLPSFLPMVVPSRRDPELLGRRLQAEVMVLFECDKRVIAIDAKERV